MPPAPQMTPMAPYFATSPIALPTFRGPQRRYAARTPNDPNGALFRDLTNSSSYFSGTPTPLCFRRRAGDENAPEGRYHLSEANYHARSSALYCAAQATKMSPQGVHHASEEGTSCACCAVIFAAVRQVILPSAVIFLLWTSDISRYMREEKGRIAAPHGRGYLLRIYPIESEAFCRPFRA